MERNADAHTETAQAVDLNDEIMELSEADLHKISGGLKNDGIVCWWEPGPGFYVRVCMCVDN